jgi:predicted nucleotidyltransferase
MSKSQEPFSFPIPLPQSSLASFCQNHGVQRMWLYGSVVTGAFGPDSDVDVLVEFQKGKRPDWTYYTWNEELEPLWGRKVDLTSLEEFRPARLQEVLSRAKLIYER